MQDSVNQVIENANNTFDELQNSSIVFDVSGSMCALCTYIDFCNPNLIHYLT